MAMVIMTRELCTTVLLFCTAVLVMATKPVLLHLTRENGVPPMPVPHFNLFVEGAKIIICIVAVIFSRGNGSDQKLWRGWSHSLKFGVPAGMYLVMNILLVHVSRTMPPPTVQLLANTKVLTTAVASSFFLARRISAAQWFALVILTVGVTLGQGNESGHFDVPIAGVLMLLFNSCLSAVAGVIIEKTLKGPESDGMSIFGTGVHMSAYTILLNGSGLLLFGQSTFVDLRMPNLADSLALFSEAVNGILMSLIMRRLDSIMKNFAFSISVFVTAGFSTVFLGYQPSMLFYLGAGLTAMSGVLYGYCAPQAPSPASKTVKQA